MALANPVIWKIQTDVSTANGGVDLDALTMLPGGGYIVTWRDSQRIAFQLYDGKGDKVGANQFVPAGAAQQFADVKPIGLNGDFAITWTENAGTSAAGRAVKSQTYSFNGTPVSPVVTLNTTTDVVDGAQMSANDQGWMTTYVEKNVVKMVQYGGDGTPGNPLSISTETSPTFPDVAWIGGANHAVSYVSQGKAYLRVASGTTATTAISIPSAIEADVVGLKGANGAPTGEFVVVTNSDNSSNSKIEARKYHFDGTNIVADAGYPVTISTGQKPSAGESQVSVTALREGGFAVAYVASTPNVDTGDIWVRVVDATGALGQAIKVHSDRGQQLTPDISEMADGRLSVSFHNPSLSDGRSSTISTVVVDARASAAALTGTSHDDIYAPSVHENDNFNGGDGVDTLTFQAAAAGVAVDLGVGKGTAGIAKDDTYSNFENIIGSNFADTLIGGAGANKLDGGAGNDTLDGGADADVLIGGTGSDTYILDHAGDVIQESSAADGGVDTVYTAVSHALEAFVENMVATGSNAITLTGNGWNNNITGNEAANQISGGGGNDVLSGAGGNDVMDGGTGDDALYGGIGDDSLYGSDGNDALYGSDGNDILDGGAGNDVLDGGVGNDVLAGGGGDDNLQAGSGDDNLQGNDGNDVLYGADGNDALDGGAGNDVLYGGAGADNLKGGLGDDVIDGQGGADTMDGGAGNDTYYIDDVNDLVQDSGAGDVDTVVVSVNYDLNRLVGIENITGVGSAAITLTGNGLNNVFIGNDGANILYGGAGNDQLNGGGGNDRIHGGLGADLLTGGTGRDIFVFDTNPKAKRNADKITDFNVKDDSIYLENKYFKVGSKGTIKKPAALSSKMFYAGAKAHDKDDRIIYDKKKGVLYYDDDGIGSHKAVVIATLSKNLKMTAKDFFVI